MSCCGGARCWQSSVASTPWRRVLGLNKIEVAPVTFEAPEFTLPPRTIKDITELLEQHRDTNRAERERMRALADQAPPTDAEPRDLIEIYYERSNAAGEIGRPRQRLGVNSRSVRSSVSE